MPPMLSRAICCAAYLMFAVLLCVTTGCRDQSVLGTLTSAADEGERLIDQQIHAIEETNRVLRGVIDAGAKYRRDSDETVFHEQLADANRELNDLRAATTELGPRIKALNLSSSERSRLEEQHKPRFEKALIEFREAATQLKKVEIDDPAFRDFKLLIESVGQST